MTCIIGLKDNNYIYLGGDSAMSNTYTILLSKTQKVFKKIAVFENEKFNFEFGMGISGSGRQQNILSSVWEPPKFDWINDDFSEEQLYEYLCGSFLSSIRKAFKDEGFMKIENHEESYYGCVMLCIFGRIFVINSDLFIRESEFEYEAIGSGAEVALGSLHSSEKYIKDPEERIRIALEASETFIPSVRKPFHIIKIPKNRGEK